MAKKKKGKDVKASKDSTISDIEKLFFHSETEVVEETEDDGGWKDEGFGLSSLEEDDMGMSLDANQLYEGGFRMHKPFEANEKTTPKSNNLMDRKPSLGDYDQFLQQMDEEKRQKRELEQNEAQEQKEVETDLTVDSVQNDHLENMHISETAKPITNTDLEKDKNSQQYVLDQGETTVTPSSEFSNEDSDLGDLFVDELPEPHPELLSEELEIDEGELKQEQENRSSRTRPVRAEPKQSSEGAHSNKPSNQAMASQANEEIEEVSSEDTEIFDNSDEIAAPNAGIFSWKHIVQVARREGELLFEQDTAVAATCYLEAARILKQHGMTEDAIALYNKADEMLPLQGSPLRQYADLIGKQGNYNVFVNLLEHFGGGNSNQFLNLFVLI